MMMLAHLLTLTNVLASGVLAGHELSLLFAISGPLSQLPQVPHIQLRQALIRRLRVLVPAVFILAILSGGGAAKLGPRGLPLVLRSAGISLLLAFILIALIGTVPINKDVLGWNPDTPPADWRRILARWRRLDAWRAAASLLAAVAFAAALLVKPD